MLRSEARRLERRETLRRRFLAGGTAVLLALGMAAGGAAPAFAAPPSATLPAPIADSDGVTTYNQGGLTCNSSAVGFQKPDALDGNNLNNNGVYQAVNPNNWGSLSWNVSEKRVTWSINDGWDVDICVKGGTHLTIIDTSETPEGVTSYVHSYAGLSHLGFRIVSTPANTPTQVVTCESVTYSHGSPLTTAEGHFNITIDPPGSQINAYVDQNVPGGVNYNGANGLGLRITAFGVPQTPVPLTLEQVTSGVIEFRYSDFITSDVFTVKFVQTHSIDTWPNLLCGELDTRNFVVPTASQTELECDTAGTYTLDDIEGVRWFIGDEEVQPGTYDVTTASTIVVRAEAVGPDFALDPEADSEFTFVFNAPEDCELPCLPASAVSYTYYNLATATESHPANSGLITVTARDGYSDELCNPFWVVAAAWNFSSSTSIWPQTLKGTDPAGDHDEGYIDSVGTYFYYVPVDCGQGDVYASFTAMPYIGPELFGPSDPFTEKFLHDMGFTGPNPTYLVTAPGCNVANPIAPTATPILECNTYGSIDISDVANPYVGYAVYRGAADSEGSVAGLETVPVAEAKEGVFTVVATAMNGYVFAPGTIRQWEFNLGTFYLCELPELPITNASIGFIDPTCDAGQQLDPAKLLVEDESLAELESYEVFDDNTYEVVFVTIDDDARFFDSDAPTPGRTVSEGGTKLTFRGTLDGPLTGDDCDREIEVVDPYGYTDTCLEDPSYWVDLIEGLAYTITVNDETPFVVEWEGVNERRTFLAAPGTTLNITAAATEGFTLAPQPGPLDHVFQEWPDECLPTLPLVEGSVTFTPASCLDATNWVTLPDVEGVQWWVDGEETAAGKWAMPAGEVVVNATALDGFGFSQEATTQWEHTFAAADDVCDLSELAETGASNALVGIGFAAVIITLAGMGVVIGRRIQQA